MYIKNLIYLCSEEGVPIRAHLSRFIDVDVLPSSAIIWKRYDTNRNTKSKIKHMFPILAKWYRTFRSVNKRESKEDIEYSMKIFGRNIFSLSNSPTRLLTEANIPYKVIYANNINDQNVIDELNNLDCDYVVVAKARGILREKIFSTKKVFINAHKGYLPDFRGSSPTHWSILCGGQYGATVHFMDKGIDTGSIIKRKKFKPPLVNSEKQRKVYEAHIVSDVLSEVLYEFNKMNEFSTVAQDETEGETYYKPHPLLSEISLSSQFKRVLRKHTHEKALLESFQKEIESCLQSRHINSFNARELHAIIKKGLKEHIFEYDAGKEIYDYFLSLDEMAQMSEQNAKFFLKKFQKQIDVGWICGQGVRQSSSVYLLDTISLILLTYLYVALYKKSSDLRFLNTSFKLTDVLRSIDTSGLTLVELVCMYIAIKDQSFSLDNLRSKIIS